MNNTAIEVPETGKLIVPMTNDYLFKMLLQENNNVLKALVQDLLHLEEGSIRTITITNPIQLGDHIDDKTIMLDIKALMNDYSVVNLEMQVINEKNHHVYSSNLHLSVLDLTQTELATEDDCSRHIDVWAPL